MTLGYLFARKRPRWGKHPAIQRTMPSLFSSLAIVLMGCGSNATASIPASPSTNRAQTSGVTLTFLQFTAALLEEALPEVCGNPQSMLRTCFTVDEAQCRKHFGDAMMACSENERFD